MTFEPVLLTLLTISAPIALTAALVRLIALFAAPYVDPAKSVENWRGPGLRVWLLLIPVFTLCIGGLAVYGLGQVLLNDGLHWSLRLASFFGLTMVASMGFGAIGLALKAQNRLVLDHALETRRPGETMPGIRSANLLEIGALFVFGAGFILISGFGIPDLRDASLLPFEEIQTRLRLLDLLAYVTFFAGVISATLRVSERVSGTGGVILSWLALPVAGGVFQFIHRSAVPSRFDLKRYAAHPDSPDVAANIMTGLVQSEALALIGLTLIATLVAGPFLDRVLQQVDRDGRLIRRARLLFFLATLAGSAGFALSTSVADLLTPPFFLPALVLAASGAAGCGLLRREPKIAEPVPVEVF